MYCVSALSLATADSRKRKRTMTDKRNSRNKIEGVNKPAKGSWPVVGFRAHPDAVHRYDRAALALRIKRSEFLERSADALAARVLADEDQGEARKGERRQGERRAPFDGEAAAA